MVLGLSVVLGLVTGSWVVDWIVVVSVCGGVFCDSACVALCADANARQAAKAKAALHFIVLVFDGRRHHLKMSVKLKLEPHCPSQLKCTTQILE